MNDLVSELNKRTLKYIHEVVKSYNLHVQIKGYSKLKKSALIAELAKHLTYDFRGNLQLAKTTKEVRNVVGNGHDEYYSKNRKSIKAKFDTQFKKLKTVDERYKLLKEIEEKHGPNIDVRNIPSVKTWLFKLKQETYFKGIKEGRKIYH